MGARLKTINADEAAYEGFRQLAKEYKLTSPELVATMVQYFRVTKADPTQPTGPDLTTLLAKLGGKLDALDKRTIGFIREQEKQYLKPILAEVQAHKVLSAPAASAPAELSDAQVQELRQWLELVLLRGLQPIALTKTFQAKAPAPVAKDPQLEPVKKALLAVLRQALVPEILTAALNPTPAAPASGAAPAPASAPVSPPSQPA
ncbi:hypothetical protein SAMN02745146_0344 [Hymenobacter daecheongensis DSM 21074]|uniref:Uncharacterized protein n=1 Tax=Hymenobacter daecheongensis DSM 21074 TaxID=1121955 RepID=A0A1M6MNZ8_9BACT|nr:BfmA/BtgA family mobilization protein [Hymenobacter daecheongensis]SHJ85100.1 hypothetical protein SAMN02745146_0344 [Hymenobacter daecheongensis DSM 21074]